MTMICEARNKAELKEKLDAGCIIKKPTPWGVKEYDSTKIVVGWQEPVCLDPETRRRFATIARHTDGWKVT